MPDVTQILSQIESGNPTAAEQLLPLVYEELRKLAAARMRYEKPGQTLQATALVHEAYLRLVDAERSQHWNGQGHFFAAAAEAMRRILIENARRKKNLKAGGDRKRIALSAADVGGKQCEIDLIALDEALKQLEAEDARAAQVLSLRFFAGLTIKESADALGISPATADNDWAYARSWLRLQLSSDG